MIPRSSVCEADAFKLDYDAAESRSHRAQCKAEGRCICGPKVGTVGKFGVEHGPPVTPGGRCARCVAARKERP